jgi:hypothetical protein
MSDACQRAPQNRPLGGAPKPARGSLRKRVVIGWVWACLGTAISGGASGWFSVRPVAGIGLSFPVRTSQFPVPHLWTPEPVALARHLDHLRVLQQGTAKVSGLFFSVQIVPALGTGRKSGADFRRSPCR